MRHKLIDLLEQSPVLPAVKDEDALPRALRCESRVVFLLGGDLLSIRRWIDLTHEAGKQAAVHLDLVGGLAPREVAVDWLQQQGADGIISTRPHLIRRGRELGLLTVLRVFAIDSKAVGNLQKETEMVTPDVIEILPGTLPRVIERLSKKIPVPLIAGGLMTDKSDIVSALQAGALCASTSDEELWEV
jgi:glycerol uptake operon antiterminator